MSQLEVTFARTLEHWNKITENLSRKMQEMPEHGLYALWMNKELVDVLQTFITLTALQSASAPIDLVKSSPLDKEVIQENLETEKNRLECIQNSIDSMRRLGDSSLINYMKRERGRIIYFCNAERQELKDHLIMSHSRQSHE